MSQPKENILKAPAKVLGCLRPGHLTVLVGYGLGMVDGGAPHEISMDLVPFDLRMPNSEFTVVMDRARGQFVAVERQRSNGEEGQPDG